MLATLNRELGLNVATMMDTKGIKIRIGEFKKEDGGVRLAAGERFTITTREVLGTEKMVSVSYKAMPNDVKKGDKIYIDDGLLELDVESVDSSDIVCLIRRGGVVSSHKGVNLPNIKVSMPFISKEDEKDIDFGINLGFDSVAISFVRTGDDVLQVRKLLAAKKSEMKVIAKIENREGVNNIEAILKVADGVMVARGDLGVELPYEELPIVQKTLVRLSCKAKKPAIVATQILESMRQSSFPTRAEGTDVANAVLEGASALLLSSETAVGNHPIEAVCAMAKLITYAEKNMGEFKSACWR
jgi:pyruvate kinase